MVVPRTVMVTKGSMRPLHDTCPVTCAPVFALLGTATVQNDTRINVVLTTSHLKIILIFMTAINRITHTIEPKIEWGRKQGNSTF